MIKIMDFILNNSSSSSNQARWWWAAGTASVKSTSDLFTTLLLFGLPLHLWPHSSSVGATTKNEHTTWSPLSSGMEISSGTVQAPLLHTFFIHQLFKGLFLFSHHTSGTCQYIAISIFDLSNLLCIPPISLSLPPWSAFIILSPCCPTIPHSATKSPY